MDSKTLLQEALHLRPAERLQLIEWLAKSLDKPNDTIDQLWAEESEKRYEALLSKNVKTFTIEEIIQRYK